MSKGKRVHGKGFYHLRVIDGEANNVMWLDPLDGVLMGVQHVFRLKLLLLCIFMKELIKDVVLELAEL